MMIRKRRFARSAAVTFLLWLVLVPNVNASPLLEFADTAVKQQVQAQFRREYAGSLNRDPQASDTKQDFTEAKLGDGVAVYILDTEERSVKLNGYEFPILLENETIGVVATASVQNEWEIFYVSLGSDLPDILQSATTKTWPGATLKYVNDPGHRNLRGFLIESDTGELFFDLNQNKAYPIEELYASVERMSDSLTNDAKGSREAFWKNDSWLLSAIVTLSGGAAIVVLLKLKKRWMQRKTREDVHTRL